MNECSFFGNRFPNPYTIWINGKNVREYHALVESFSIGGTPVKNEIFQGRNRTSWTQLSYTVGMRSITFSLFFSGPNRRALTLDKSAVDALMIGKVELHMPDGFYYTSSLKSLGDLKILGVEGNRVIGLCTYKLEGIRHDELQMVTGNTVYAQGTMPRMDCILSCTTTQARATLQLGPATFSDVPAGAAVVANGMTGELTVNGAQVKAAFTRLPFLTPGENTIQCPETLTVQYYPTYI